jgi:multidrug efflux pump subunit AcrB
MNFNFSAWSIRNPVPSLILFFVLMLVGVQAFNALPITRFPNIDIPLVAVSVTQSGAAPAELEKQITRKVEDAVSGIAGVKNITSTMNDGVSVTAVEFRMEVPTNEALEDVKDAITKIRSDLPSDADNPIVEKIDVEGQAIQQYAASNPNLSLEQLSWHIDDVVKRELQGLAGVGRVSRYGGVNREIRVELDPATLQAFGVTAAEVNRQIATTSVDLGGGTTTIEGREQAIRTLGASRSLDELGATVLSLPGGRRARLDEMAKIYDAYEKPASFATHKGQQVVTFSVYRAKGSSAKSVGDKVEAALAKLRTQYPEMKYELVDDTVYYIYGNYKAAIASLIEGAVLAIIVVLLFLRDWRATLISALALPLSAIPAFWAMSLMGFSLNLVSFLGITLATGILVDDAIVEIENIARHMKMGKSAYRASLEAADEIGLAVIAITFTIIAVFVPVSFMEGVPGQYFRQFGLTVAVAVFFSLLVARLITPMMAAYFMREYKHHEEEKPGILGRFYTALIRFANAGPTLYVEKTPRIASRSLTNMPQRLMLKVTAVIRYVIALFAWLVPASRRRRAELAGLDDSYEMRRPRLMSYVTVLAAIGTLFASTSLIPLLPTGFIPKGDESRMVFNVELPPGSRLEDTRTKTEEVLAIIEKNPHVESVFVLGGASALGDQSSRYAAIFVNLKRKADGIVPGLVNPNIARINRLLGVSLPLFHADGRTVPQWDVEAEIYPQLQKVADVRLSKVIDRGTREVQFNLLSADPEALALATQKMESELRKQKELLNPTIESALDRPEIRVRPKADEAAKLGITAQQISDTVRVAVIGDFGPALAKYNAGDRLIPIRVQLPENAVASVSEISNLKLTSASGSTVPISSVADISFELGPSTVKRLNRERLSVVGADIAAGFELGQASLAVNKAYAVAMGYPSVLNFVPAVTEAQIKSAANDAKVLANVRLGETGDSEIQGEIFTSFGKAALLGVIIMLGILILLLGNVFQPLAIVFSLPLSIGGVVLALLWSNMALSMPVVIGMLMLMGIVAKNAIMLIDFAVERVRHGMERVDAIVDAGSKRARPIVMTTIAMAAGMLPAAYGIGEGGEFRAPMATAVIGGLIASTVLSLVFVPSFYIVMDDASRLTSWLFNRFVGKSDEPTLVDPTVELANELEQAKARVSELEQRMAPREVAAPVVKPTLSVAAE